MFSAKDETLCIELKFWNKRYNLYGPFLGLYWSKQCEVLFNSLSLNCSLASYSCHTSMFAVSRFMKALHALLGYWWELSIKLWMNRSVLTIWIRLLAILNLVSDLSVFCDRWYLGPAKARGHQKHTKQVEPRTYNATIVKWWVGKKDGWGQVFLCNSKVYEAHRPVRAVAENSEKYISCEMTLQVHTAKQMNAHK